MAVYINGLNDWNSLGTDTGNGVFVVGSNIFLNTDINVTSGSTINCLGIGNNTFDGDGNTINIDVDVINSIGYNQLFRIAGGIIKNVNIVISGGYIGTSTTYARTAILLNTTFNVYDTYGTLDQVHISGVNISGQEPSGSLYGTALFAHNFGVSEQLSTVRNCSSSFTSGEDSVANTGYYNSGFFTYCQSTAFINCASELTIAQGSSSSGNAGYAIFASNCSFTSCFSHIDQNNNGFIAIYNSALCILVHGFTTIDNVTTLSKNGSYTVAIYLVSNAIYDFINDNLLNIIVNPMMSIKNCAFIGHIAFIYTIAGTCTIFFMKNAIPICWMVQHKQH